MLTLYVMIAYGLMNASFKLIDLLPSAVLDWIGGRGGTGEDGGERVGGAAAGAISRVGGLRIGAAAALPGAGDDSHRKTQQYTWQAMPGRRLRRTLSGSIWNYACNQ